MDFSDCGLPFQTEIIQATSILAPLFNIEPRLGVAAQSYACLLRNVPLCSVEFVPLKSYLGFPLLVAYPGQLCEIVFDRGLECQFLRASFNILLAVIHFGSISIPVVHQISAYLFICLLH